MAAATVLCIDDQVPALKLRKESLENCGFIVETASSVRMGMKLLEQDPIAVVLLEYKQEGMDAEAVAFQIRQRFPSMPIVLLSAYSEMPERILWLVDEYVMKSASASQLVSVIRKLIRVRAIAA